MFAALMTDRCEVYRMTEAKTAWGETRQERTLIGSYPCRISQLGLADAQRPDPVGRVNYAAKLFLPPDVDIQHGDEVHVNRTGAMTAYYAGEAFRYPMHTEVMLRRQDWA